MRLGLGCKPTDVPKSARADSQKMQPLLPLGLGGSESSLLRGGFVRSTATVLWSTALPRPDATTPDTTNRGPVVVCLRAPTSAETLPFYSPGRARPPRGSGRGRRFRRRGFDRTPLPPAPTPRRTGHGALGGTRESQA